MFPLFTFLSFLRHAQGYIWLPALICLVLLSTARSSLAQENRIKVGLALGYGELEDMSFNQMQYNGLIRASQAHDIDITYRLSAEEGEENMLVNLTALVNEDCDLIFAGGHTGREQVMAIAPEHPHIHFVVLDNPVRSIPNVSSAVYAQHEGSFVVGYLAARFSPGKRIGFIGGVDIPVIQAFYRGFEEGVRHGDPDASLIVTYLSEAPDFSGFADPDKGYALAEAMYQGGVDTIYAVAGATNTGVIRAAETNNAYVIGVDSNQDHLARGHVLTSMLKRLDVSIVDLVGKYLQGELEGGRVYEYTYANNGVSITEMEFTRELIGEDVIQEVRDVEQAIIEGRISVTNVHEELLNQ
ncbi:MAG: BMP family ABC transporter substrate-binding protein [Desulfovibrio sp.]|nr:MAG: BMP family ABC transporter substrate-binding protein [Desulfovibrio sp.]